MIFCGMVWGIFDQGTDGVVRSYTVFRARRDTFLTCKPQICLACDPPFAEKKGRANHLLAILAKIDPANSDSIQIPEDIAKDI